MFNHLLGTFSINQSTIFDFHLLTLLLPLLLMAFTFSIDFKKIPVMKKNVITTGMSLTILAMTTLAMMQYSDVKSESIDNFKNLDLLSGSIFALALLTRRFGVARIASTSVLVFSTMRLINNPGVTLDVVEAILDILLICSVIIFLSISNKTISVLEFAFGQVVNFVMISYVFVFNDLAKTSFSTFSLHEISKNPVYQWLHHNAQKIVFFLILLTSSQLSVWLIIRIKFFVKNSEQMFSFIALFKHLHNEIKSSHKGFKNKFSSKTSSFMELETIDEMEVTNDQSNEELVMPESNIDFNYMVEKIISSVSITKTNNAQGTRAPSF